MMGQLTGVGAPLDLTTGLESVLWGFLPGSGWRIGVGVGGGSGVAGADGSKELVFPKTFKGMPRSLLTSALPTAELRGLKAGTIHACSALALALVLPRVSHIGSRSWLKEERK